MVACLRNWAIVFCFIRCEDGSRPVKRCSDGTEKERRTPCSDGVPPQRACADGSAPVSVVYTQTGYAKVAAPFAHN